MLVLVGCEESQAVTIEFRRMGHEAYSCDTLPCSGGHPEWHLQMDVYEAIKLKPWDLGIFFPPCTYICSSGLHWNKRVPEREALTEEALQFVAGLMNSSIAKISLENPIGCIPTRLYKDTDGVFKVAPESTKGVKPTQIVQPWFFGDPESKSTCLYLQNLQPLQVTDPAKPKRYKCQCDVPYPAEEGDECICGLKAKPVWDNQTLSGQNKLGPSCDRAKLRSKTYPGIAKAMAYYWDDMLF